MPSIPRLLLAVGLFLSLSAQSAPIEPAAPVDAAVWNQLADWQKELFNKTKDLPRVRNETMRRELLELERLADLEYSWQERRAQPGPADVQKFIKDFRSLKTRFPLPAPHPDIDRVSAFLARRVAFYETEAVYRDAHPQQAAAAKALEAKTAASKLGPGASKEDLDRFYENSAPGSQTPGAAGGPGVKSPPPMTPSQKRIIDGKGPPPPLRWKYEARDGAGPEEKAFVELIMTTLDAPVERDILARAAEQQSITALEMKGRENRVSAGIKAVQAELQDKRLGANDRAHLQQLLAQHKDSLAEIKLFDPVLIVSMGEFPKGTGARTYIDKGAGPDGRQHVRVVLNRDFTSDPFPAKDNPKDAARKVAAHEFTHAGDFYAVARDDGPSERWLEPRAFRNGAVSYLQEGMPQGVLVDRWGGNDFRWLRSDPVGFMHRQALDYSSETSITGPKGIWDEFTPDDFADPAKGLDWRMQYAYRYSTVMGSTQPGESREKRLTRLGTAFNLHPESISDLVALDADKTVPEERKAALFAQRAAVIPSSKIWIANVGKAPKDMVAKARREEKDFFDSLKPLFP